MISQAPAVKSALGEGTLSARLLLCLYRVVHHFAMTSLAILQTAFHLNLQLGRYW